MCSKRRSSRVCSRCTARRYVSGSFSSRRWPTITTCSRRGGFDGALQRWRRLEDHDALGASARPPARADRAPAARPDASLAASERCASPSLRMSRYRSVPVSTTISGRVGHCARPRIDRPRAERRACSAISSDRVAVSRTAPVRQQADPIIVCQHARPAVRCCQLPLLACGQRRADDEQRAARTFGRHSIDLPVIESPRLREAGRDVLSLALIDARNHTLRLFSVGKRRSPRKASRCR